MFLDLLDTIKTSENFHKIDACKANAVQGESMLYYLLLTGQTPTLTQTQAMDSKIIHNILNDGKSRSAFLTLLATGKIQLELYTGSGARSLQDYFKKSLMYGLNEGTDFFNFSTMPFLEQYDPKIRKNLQANIVSALQDNCYDFKTDGVCAEHIDYLTGIIDDMQDIDRAIRGNCLYCKAYQKNMDDLVWRHCQELMKSEETDTSFLKLCYDIISKYDYGNRRSAYYKYLDILKQDYSNDDIEKMKQLVDNCYNEALASSTNNNACNLNISSKFADLAQPIQQNGNVTKKEIIKIRPSRADQYLTWETLSQIMTEVERIEKVKKLSRTDALTEYKRKQSFKPIVSTVKYLEIGAVTSLIPGIPDVVEILSDVISGAVSDAVGDKLKKPSLHDITVSAKDGAKKTQIANNAIEFLSMTMK